MAKFPTIPTKSNTPKSPQATHVWDIHAVKSTLLRHLGGLNVNVLWHSSTSWRVAMDNCLVANSLNPATAGQLVGVIMEMVDGGDLFAFLYPSGTCTNGLYKDTYYNLKIKDIEELKIALTHFTLGGKNWANTTP